MNIWNSILYSSTFWHWKMTELWPFTRLGSKYLATKNTFSCNNIRSRLNLHRWISNITSYFSNGMKNNYSSTFWHWKLFEFDQFQVHFMTRLQRICPRICLSAVITQVQLEFSHLKDKNHLYISTIIQKNVSTWKVTEFSQIEFHYRISFDFDVITFIPC